MQRKELSLLRKLVTEEVLRRKRIEELLATDILK